MNRIAGAAPAESRSIALWYPVDQQGPFHCFTFKVDQALFTVEER